MPASAGIFTCGSVYLRPSQVILHAPVLQCSIASTHGRRQQAKRRVRKEDIEPKREKKHRNVSISTKKNTPVIEQDISDRIQREMDVMVSKLDDRVKKAIVTAVNDMDVPRVQIVVKSNQCGLSRVPGSLVNNIELVLTLKKGKIQKRAIWPLQFKQT